MQTFDTFITTLQRRVPVDQSERERLAGLWPGAAQTADDVEKTIPPVPWLSPSSRRDIFLRICTQIDTWQEDQVIDDEQAQLALTLLRGRHRGYRRAEASFVAWARTEPESTIERMPLTAQQLMLGVNFRRRPRSPSA